MPAPEYLQHLHAYYAALAGENGRRLTSDEKRSLLYFHHDVADADASTDIDQPTGRVRAWIRQAHAVDQYVEDHGRIPRRNSRATAHPVTDGERRLSVWLEDHRRPAARARQCSYQRERILAYPGLDGRNLEDRWADTLIDYRTFLGTHGRVPAARSKERDERALALWASNQRRRNREGHLDPHRRAALTALPIWAWGVPSARP